MKYLNLKAAITEFREKDPATEATLKYFIVYIAGMAFIEEVLSVIFHIPDPKPSEAPFLIHAIAIATFTFFIGKWIMARFMRANGTDGGRFFWDRLIVLNCVISLRIALFVLPAAAVLKGTHDFLESSLSPLTILPLLLILALALASVVYWYNVLHRSFLEINAGPDTNSSVR